jgi:hypothetical protein
MILHLASTAAFFVDQVQQAPVQVQCIQQAAPESWAKWLLQFALSAVPVAGGVGIALWSFHATSKKDHERWILDQKKAEWQELLRSAARMRRVVSLGIESPQTRAQLIHAGLKPAVQELEVSAANCVFLSDFFGDQVKSRRFYSFLRNADLDAEKMDASFLQTRLLEHPSPDLTDQQRERGRQTNILERGDLADRIAREFIDFNDWLRTEAAISLGALSGAPNEVAPTPSE